MQIYITKLNLYEQEINIMECKLIEGIQENKTKDHKISTLGRAI